MCVACVHVDGSMMSYRVCEPVALSVNTCLKGVRVSEMYVCVRRYFKLSCALFLASNHSCTGVGY